MVTAIRMGASSQTGRPAGRISQTAHTRMVWWAKYKVKTASFRYVSAGLEDFLRYRLAKPSAATITAHWSSATTALRGIPPKAPPPG